MGRGEREHQLRPPPTLLIFSWVRKRDYRHIAREEGLDAREHGGHVEIHTDGGGVLHGKARHQDDVLLGLRSSGVGSNSKNFYCGTVSRCSVMDVEQGNSPGLMQVDRVHELVDAIHGRMGARRYHLRKYF